MANVTKSANVYFPMPPSGSQAWVSAYLAPSGKGIGVYLRLARGEFGDSAFEDLQAEQEAINEELGLPEVEWRSRNGKHSISTRMAGVDPLDPAQQEDIRQWIADHVNRFVNVFRPRLARLVATA